MNIKIKIGFITAVLFMVVLFPGCIVDESEEDEISEDELLPITVVDDKGNNITINKWPEKIFSLSASVTEILYALKLGDSIVGVDSGSDYPPEAKNHTMVFDGYSSLLNTEELVSRDPDLVILDHILDTSENARNAIRGFGYNIMILNPIIIEDILDNILLIGKVTNRNSEARTLADSLELRIDDVEEAGRAINSTAKPKILYVIYYDGQSNPWVSGKKTLVDDMINRAGGMNVITALEGNLEINLETIIDEDPDIILTSQSSSWPTESRNKILYDPIFKSIKAVKNNRVYDIDGDTTVRPGPRIVDGLEEINELISDAVGD